MGLDLTKKINRIVVDGEEAIVVGTPALQDKEVVPSKEPQVVSADTEFDAIKTVTVLPIPDEYIVPEGSLEVTENDTYDVRSLAEIIVNVEGSGGEDLFSQYISGETDKLVVNTNKFIEGAFSGFKVKELELLQPHTEGWTGTIFYNCTNLQKMNYIRQGSFGQNQFSNCGASDYSTSEVIATFNMDNVTETGGNNAFRTAKLKEVTFNGLVAIGKSTTSLPSSLFYGAKIQKVSFPDLTTMYVPSSTSSRNFYQATIDRLYLEKLTSIKSNAFYIATSIPKTFLGSNCSLENSSTATIPNGMTRFYVPYDSIEFYANTTNWTTFFSNSGSDETRMFVYGDFTSGDSLPTQTGTTTVYNIKWYEDDNFTTEVSGTATNTARYYGKISAVV